MTDRMLNNRVSKLQALQVEIDSLIAQADELKEEFKAEMQACAVDELEAGNAVIRWKPVYSTRFDAKAFRAAHSSLYKEYAVPTTTRRFTLISA